jgi:hypothetical protein
MRVQLEIGEGDLLDGELDPALVGMNAPPFVPREPVEAENGGKDQDHEERSMSSHEGPVRMSGFVSGLREIFQQSRGDAKRCRASLSEA